MIQNVLRHTGGIEVYGLVSLGLFFLVFLGIGAWALRLKKPFLDSMAALPLETDADTGEAAHSPQTNDRHE